MVTEENIKKVIEDNRIEEPMFFIYRKETGKNRPYPVIVISTKDLSTSFLPLVWNSFEIFFHYEIAGLYRYIMNEITADEVTFNIIKSEKVGL